jgi:oligopeptide/dipeptide ABC transporter ATP-binding protein
LVMGLEIWLIQGTKEFMNETILSIQELRTEFHLPKRTLLAVRDASLHVNRGEVVGLVGESGCGKSMTAYSILHIVPEPGKITRGSIHFQSQDLTKLGPQEMQKIRGKDISLVFQDPLSSLNPVYDIYWHFLEVYAAHSIRKPQADKRREVVQLLQTVGIQEPEEKLHYYPHQLSGGMRQRVVIALSLLLNPVLLIADEPTTALDVTTQRAIFDLLQKLRKQMGISIIIISHDLYLIAEQCDRMYVMYAGEIVETGKAQEILHAPQHPYTIGLMKSIPTLDTDVELLQVIPGELKNTYEAEGDYCCFADRCYLADEACYAVKPPVVQRGDHYTKCLKV